MASQNGDGTVKKPLNREPEGQDLAKDFITPIGPALYDRNHGPIPHIKAEDHIVTVDGLVENALKLGIQSLKHDFTQHKLVCALECAGNRRHQMRTRLQDVQGIDWFNGAILNAEWEGPLLRDVLLKAGVNSQSHTADLHVAFACYQTKTQDADWYGGSIPFSKAMSEDSEIILALKMNGEVLTDKHGYPVRSVVPGVLGARSVKWLDRITISAKQSPNFYQQHDYKILPPDATDGESAEKYWDQVPPMMDNCINSCVLSPEDDDTVHLSANGTIKVKGYAVPQGADGPIVRVEVSADEGKHWTEAMIRDGGEMASKWSWVLWEAELKMEKGEKRRIFSKATDRKGNTQTEERSQWNLRGVGYNGYESITGLTVL